MTDQSQDYKNRIDWLRARAGEVRTVARTISHIGSKTELFRMADVYETVARQLESLMERRLIGDED